MSNRNSQIFSTASLLSSGAYHLDEEIGSGAYGVVYKGLRDDDGKQIALKRIFVTDKDGNNNIPLSTHRELCALKKLNSFENKNIVQLFDVVLNKIEGKMCMDLIFELGDYDLEKYLKMYNSKAEMPIEKIINLSRQLLGAIYFMHSYCVIHRDLKPANILINKSGTDLKITDFGLARILGFDSSLTPVVVTLWYRSPEILLQKSYLTACDVWSAGCIIAEMVHGRPVFQGENELSQIEKIVTRLGYEAINNWPDDNAIDRKSLTKLIDKSRGLDCILKRVDRSFLKLIKELLRFNPDARLLSNEACLELDRIERRFSQTKCFNVENEYCDDQSKVVESVVRNVLSESQSVLIPGRDENDIDSENDRYSIGTYPNGEVEIEGLMETPTDTETETDDCDDYDEEGETLTLERDNDSSSCSIADENADKENQSITVDVNNDNSELKENDEIGDSFSSYRSRENHSFSSYAPSSHTGFDSTTDEDLCEEDDNHSNDNYNNKSTNTRSKSRSLLTSSNGVSSTGLTELNENLTITDNHRNQPRRPSQRRCHSDLSPFTTATTTNSQSDIFLPRSRLERINSTPFKEVNDCNRLKDPFIAAVNDSDKSSVPPTQSIKPDGSTEIKPVADSHVHHAHIRKRYLNPADDDSSCSCDSDSSTYTHGNGGVASASDYETRSILSPIVSDHHHHHHLPNTRPNLFRQKSLRRRISMLESSSQSVSERRPQQNTKLISWTPNKYYFILNNLLLLHCVMVIHSDMDWYHQLFEEDTYELSPYYPIIVEHLLLTANRRDIGQWNLRKAVYHALIDMITTARRDCYPSLHDITVHVLQKLDGILGMDQAALATQDPSQLAEYKELLCMVLKVLLGDIYRVVDPKLVQQMISEINAWIKPDQTAAEIIVSNEEFLGALCNLVGLIAIAWGQPSQQILNTEWIEMLLTKGSTCGTYSTQRYAAWARQVMTVFNEGKIEGIGM